MTDLISRADAIGAVCNAQCELDVPHYPQCDQVKYCDEINALLALPSAETHEIRTETHGVCLISKDDAMGAVQDHFNANGFKGYDDGQKMMDRIKALPSADAVSREECDECKTDKEGVLLQQLAELRGDYDTLKKAYEEALSADAVSREFYEDAVKANIGLVIENRELKEQIESADVEQGEWHQISPARIYECSICNHNVLTDYIDTYNYCPNCGARMKGGDTE